MNKQNSSKKPYFARFLEDQELARVDGGGRGDLQTLKYPSDDDEGPVVTLKYPSDDDEGGITS